MGKELQSQHPALTISPAPRPPWGALCLGSLLVVLGGHYLKLHYPWASPGLASGWGLQGHLPPHSHILSLQTGVGVGKQGGRLHERSSLLAREGSPLLFVPDATGWHQTEGDRIGDPFSCVTSHSVAELI